MRTTVDLDDALLEQAMKDTGIKQKTALLEEGLRTLIDRFAQKRLAALLGQGRGFNQSAAPRRRDLRNK